VNTSMHGQLIDYIELNPAWTQHGNPERVYSRDGMTLRLSATHHGDHDQFWIVLSSSTGVELTRYNPRGVERIQWLPDNGGAPQ
jgi:hypothetical protein